MSSLLNQYRDQKKKKGGGGGVGWESDLLMRNDSWP